MHIVKTWNHRKIFVGKLSLLNQKLSLCPTLTQREPPLLQLLVRCPL